MGQTLCDNRHGLIANAMVTHADGYAECEAAKGMLADARGVPGVTGKRFKMGADKEYDAAEFIEACDELKVTPHVAQNKA